MKKSPLKSKRIQTILRDIFEDDIHAKRILSISNAVVGALTAGMLAVHFIGKGLALAEGLLTKHAIKQVDRLLSNSEFCVWSYFSRWVPYVIGSRKQIIVALDWTEFDKDNQSTIAAMLLTKHGRATPLIWKSVTKSKLKGWRNTHEDDVLRRLSEVLPQGIVVTIVADRGFCDHKLYEFLTELGFDYVIRFRKGIHVRSAKGEEKSALQWTPTNCRPKLLQNARVMGHGYEAPSIGCVKKARMKDPWCLASSLYEVKASGIIRLYGMRFRIEETF